MKYGVQLAGIVFPFWSLNTAAGLVHSDRLRQRSPRLRRSAIAAILFGYALLALSVAVLWAKNRLHNHLEDVAVRTASASEALLFRIEREISDLGEDALLTDYFSPSQPATCLPEHQQRLLERSGASLLVREFKLTSLPDGVEQDEALICSVPHSLLTSINPNLSSINRIHIDRLETPAPGILLVSRVKQGIVVAFVDERQITERLIEAPNLSLILETTSGRWLLTKNSSMLSDHRSTVLLESLVAISGYANQSGSAYSLETKGLRFIVVANPQAFFESFRSVIPIVGPSAFICFLLTVVLVNRHLAARGSIDLRLRTALRKRRFVPVFQPIIDSQSGHTVGFEVLMRWKHPLRGLLPPAEFLDYAERSGLIVPMSDLLMRQACAQVVGIIKHSPRLYFSFNVTPAQLRVPGFVAQLKEIFDGSPLAPAQVLLELTERDLVDSHARSQLLELRSLGFRIAIDDFGTGQSSLALLRELSIDRLKIDRAFVSGIAAHQANPVLDAIIGLSKSLNLPMVAEGIETEEQAQYLRNRGVEAFQGFLYARPMPVQELEAWLITRSEPGFLVDETVLDADFNELLVSLDRNRHRLESTRFYGLHIYRNCMLGSELVTWIAHRLQIDREAAVKFGQRLIAGGWLSHVVDEHDLKDAPYFYRLVTAQAITEGQTRAEGPKIPLQTIKSHLFGPHGVQLGRRSWGLLSVEGAVSGAEIVSALMRSANLSAEQAVAAGVELMRAGILRHPFDERGFSTARGAPFLVLAKD